MDVGTVIASAVISTALNLVCIVMLYNGYIIPRIVSRVRDELLESIGTWVSDLKEGITADLGERLEAMKRSVLNTLRGKRGRDVTTERLAKAFLDANLPDDLDDLDAPDVQPIVAEAISRFGSELVRGLLAARSPAASNSVEW